MGIDHKSLRVGDTVVVKDGKKKIAGCVVKSAPGLLGIERIDDFGVEETLDIDSASATLLANLGEDPEVGSVYGAKINKVYSSVLHPTWGNIKVMRELSPEAKEHLRASLKESWGRIKRMGLDKIITLDYLLIKDPKGRYDGCYRQCKRGSSILLFPKSFGYEHNLTSLLDHELAHAIWYQYLPESSKYKWAMLYQEYIDRHCYTADLLDEIREDLINNPDSPEAYATRWSDETEYAALTHLLSIAKSCTGFEPDDLALVLENCKNVETRETFFPTTANAVWRSNGETPIGEYAMVSVKEFMAEAYRIYMGGNDLPKNIRKLLIDTVPVSKAKV